MKREEFLYLLIMIALGGIMTAAGTINRSSGLVAVGVGLWIVTGILVLVSRKLN